MLETFKNNSGVIIIDVQKDREEKLYCFSEFKENIKKLLKKARKDKIKIIYLFELDDKEKSLWINFWKKEKIQLDRDLDKAIPCSFLNICDKEKVVIKNNFDGFYNTDLDNYLKESKIKHLYICGRLTGVCILNTVFTAFQKGYEVTLIKNCCTDEIKERHEMVINYYNNYLFLTTEI